MRNDNYRPYFEKHGILFLHLAEPAGRRRAAYLKPTGGRWVARPPLLCILIPAFPPTNQLSLSDRLAMQRSRLLAYECTLLTYVRTSLALVRFGLALLELHPA